MKKLAPKKIKICNGCPPKELPTIKFPKFTIKLPKTDIGNVTSLKSSKDSVPIDGNKKAKRGETKSLF